MPGFMFVISRGEVELTAEEEGEGAIVVGRLGPGQVTYSSNGMTSTLRMQTLLLGSCC